MADVFAALGHPTRMRVMTECGRAARSTSQLQRSCAPISLPGMRKHLQVLEDAGLLRRTKVGRTVWCSAVPGSTNAAADYLLRLQSFWTDQLDSLANSLEK